MQIAGNNLENAIVTVYKDIYDKQPHHKHLKTILERIKAEKTIDLVQRVRNGEKEIKMRLPSICFSGKFGRERVDSKNLQHSGMVILDFDHLSDDDMTEKWQFLVSLPYVVAVFTSPSGDGIKCIVRIADPSKHRQHYKALMRDIPSLDEKNINESRVCFESCDADIYINYNAEAYTKYIESEKREVGQSKTDNETFNNIKIWLDNKGEAFVTGSRNDYMFKLASACCRFGISQEETTALIQNNLMVNDTDFTHREMASVIKSAYGRNVFGTAKFDEKRNVVDIETMREISVEENSELVQDVIYGDEVLDEALEILRYGYKSAETCGIPEIDDLMKFKRGELTLCTGIGNHGKSTFELFLLLNKSVKDGNKWGIFSPESYPAAEFYHDLVEMLVGANCTPTNQDPVPEDVYLKAYHFVKEHFFYVFPKDLSPTPEYIKSRFLQLIMKHGVDGVVIDPFNQLANDYGKNGRDDKYLETIHSDFKKFATINNVFFRIIAHPKQLKKNTDGGYDAPDVFDLAGGAMWNNKMDNIYVYHRPNRHKDPMDRVCTITTRKIKRQKIVGRCDTIEISYNRGRRRFDFDVMPIQKFDLSSPSFFKSKPLQNYHEPQHQQATEFEYEGETYIQSEIDDDVPF